jgi:hypothetical protein
VVISLLPFKLEAYMLPRRYLMQIFVSAFLLEGEFDDKRPRVLGRSAEAELDLKRGNIAFADAVAQGD